MVAEVREKAAAAGLAEVFPVGAITKGLAGESLAEIGDMVEAGVRVFSDDGNCVPTARMLRNALTYAKAFPHEVVIADHCEDPSLVRGRTHARRPALLRAGAWQDGPPKPKKPSWRAISPWRA